MLYSDVRQSDCLMNTDGSIGGWEACETCLFINEESSL